MAVVECSQTASPTVTKEGAIKAPENSKASNGLESSESSWRSEESNGAFSSIRESSVVSEGAAESPASFDLEGRDRADELGTTEFANNECDSLAIYENPVLQNAFIVQKLSHLNNIFNEIKHLRLEKLSKEIHKTIDQTEMDLIEIEREILRSF
jgi:hypothetical protein